MATLRDIKKRITSVKNTQKITKAMKMVAAAKLRRAQTNVMGSRPYLNKLKEIVLDISSQADEKKGNPLFKAREEVKKVAVLVFTSNRGLCGGFNSNLLRKADAFLKELKLKGVETELVIIGKKGREFFKARGVEISDTNVDWAEDFPFEDAAKLTEEVAKQYIDGEIDEYYLIYNKFISAITQENTIEKLLPIELEEAEETYGVEYIYEPSKEALLEKFLPKFLATQVYKSHLESLASELGARMAAMDSATKNASEMIGKLTLQYNRARQAAITTELMDIVNGAEAIS